MKRILLLLLALLLSLGTCLSLVACGGNNSDPENDEILAVYNAYRAAAAEAGDEPLDYDAWLETVKGATGAKGDKGDKGDAGANGLTPFIGENGNWWIGTTDTGVAATAGGPKGDDGKSAYEIWLEAGNEGSEADFLASLRGETGDDGKSAYEIWLEAGNEGSEADFLASLRGETGDAGVGIKNVEVARENRGGEEFVVFRVSYTDDREPDEYAFPMSAFGGGYTPPTGEENYPMYAQLDRTEFTAVASTSLDKLIEDFLIGNTLYLHYSHSAPEAFPISKEMLRYDEGFDTSVPGTLTVTVVCPVDEKFCCDVTITLTPDLSNETPIGTYTLSGALAAVLTDGAPEDAPAVSLYEGGHAVFAEEGYYTTWRTIDGATGAIALTIQGVPLAVMLDDENKTADFYIPEEAPTYVYTVEGSTTTYGFFEEPLASGEYFVIVTVKNTSVDTETGEETVYTSVCAFFTYFTDTNKSFFCPFSGNTYEIVGESIVRPVEGKEDPEKPAPENPGTDSEKSEITVYLMQGDDATPFTLPYDPSVNMTLGEVLKKLGLKLEEYKVLVNRQPADANISVTPSDTIWLADSTYLTIEIVEMGYSLFAPEGCTVKTFFGMYSVPIDATFKLNDEDATLETVLKDGDRISVKMPEEEKPETSVSTSVTKEEWDAAFAFGESFSAEYSTVCLEKPEERTYVTMSRDGNAFYLQAARFVDNECFDTYACYSEIDGNVWYDYVYYLGQYVKYPSADSVEKKIAEFLFFPDLTNCYDSFLFNGNFYTADAVTANGSELCNVIARFENGRLASFDYTIDIDGAPTVFAFTFSYDATVELPPAVDLPDAE